jgi:hypothetical protein
MGRFSSTNRELTQKEGRFRDCSSTQLFLYQIVSGDKRVPFRLDQLDPRCLTLFMENEGKRNCDSSLQHTAHRFQKGYVLIKPILLERLITT